MVINETALGCQRLESPTQDHQEGFELFTAQYILQLYRLVRKNESLFLNTDVCISLGSFDI